MVESADTRVFLSVYHDTPGRRLSRAGVTLSRRLENGLNVWHFELPADRGVRSVEQPGGPAAPPPQITHLLTGFVRGERLEPVLRFQTRRRNGTDEVEVLEGHHRRLGTFTTATKRVNAAALEALERPPEHGDRDSIRWLRAQIDGQYAAILRADAAIRLGGDPEALHQFRVALRRLQTLLRAARSILEPEWAERLRGELRWLGRSLGSLRDLDVLSDHLQSEAARLDEREQRTAGGLLATLERERESARREVQKTISSQRYLELLNSLEDAACAPNFRASELSLTDFAAAEFRRLRKRMRTIDQASPDTDLHRARILGKRARYAAELAEAQVGKPASRFVRHAKRFQDVLGAHQDAIVAEARLRGLLRSSRSTGAAFAAGRLVERERSRRRSARAELPKAWKKLGRQGTRAWA